MEKISSIVPNSRRVSAVDLNSAPAVRPGAPSFGRPMGASTVGVKDDRTTAQRAVAEFGHMNEVRRGSTSNAEIVEKMANNFFLKKAVEAPASAPVELPDISNPEPSAQSEAVQARAEDETAEDTDAETVEAQYAAGPSELPREYTPPGTYLNISA